MYRMSCGFFKNNFNGGQIQKYLILKWSYVRYSATHLFYKQNFSFNYEVPQGYKNICYYDGIGQSIN